MATSAGSTTDVKCEPCLALTSPPGRSSVPSPPARLPTWPSPPPRHPERRVPGPTRCASPPPAAAVDEVRASAVTRRNSRRAASRTSCKPRHRAHPVGSSTVSRTSSARTSGVSGRWPGEGRRRRPVLGRPSRCRSSRNSAASSRSPTSSGRWMASRSASSPGRNSPVADPSLVTRRSAAWPPTRRKPGHPRSRTVDCRHRCPRDHATHDAPGTPSRSRLGPSPAGPTRIHADFPQPAPGRVGPSFRSVLETLAEQGRLQSAALGHLHHVLIPNQIVGMHGHRGQCVVGRPGPTLGRGQLCRFENPLQAETGGTVWRRSMADRRASGSAPGQGPRVRAGRQVGHRHVDVEVDAPIRRSGPRASCPAPSESKASTTRDANPRNSLTCSSARRGATGGHRPLHADARTARSRRCTPRTPPPRPILMMSCLAQLSA